MVRSVLFENPPRAEVFSAWNFLDEEKSFGFGSLMIVFDGGRGFVGTVGVLVCGGEDVSGVVVGFSWGEKFGVLSEKEKKAY